MTNGCLLVVVLDLVDFNFCRMVVYVLVYDVVGVFGVVFNWFGWLLVAAALLVWVARAVEFVLLF